LIAEKCQKLWTEKYAFELRPRLMPGRRVRHFSVALFFCPVFRSVCVSEFDDKMAKKTGGKKMNTREIVFRYFERRFFCHFIFLPFSSLSV
jgi:hypothetical protein